MKTDRIVSVGIDTDGRLFFRPQKLTFEYISRAGMDVTWDEAQGVIRSNAPRDMSYPDWFRQIWDAALGEYGVDLRLSDKTQWINMPDELIQALRTEATKIARKRP